MTNITIENRTRLYDNAPRPESDNYGLPKALSRNILTSTEFDRGTISKHGLRHPAVEKEKPPQIPWSPVVRVRKGSGGTIYLK